MARWIQILANPRGKLPKAIDLGIDSAVECPEPNLIGVARVDHHHIRVVDQRVEGPRFDIGSDARRRVDLEVADTYYLPFESDLETVKRRLVGIRPLFLEVREAGDGSQKAKDGIDTFRRSRDRSVDAFLGEQESAANAGICTYLRQGGFEVGAVRKGRELVQRGDDALRMGDAHVTSLDLRPGASTLPHDRGHKRVTATTLKCAQMSDEKERMIRLLLICSLLAFGAIACSDSECDKLEDCCAALGDNTADDCRVEDGADEDACKQLREDTAAALRLFSAAVPSECE